MVHCPVGAEGNNSSPVIKQVEINTISSSFMSLSSRVSDLHKLIYINFLDTWQIVKTIIFNPIRNGLF